MPKKIDWTDRARSDLRAIDRENALRLLHGLARFVAVQEGDVAQLHGMDPPKYRLRVGRYRILFRDCGHSIEILEVRHRREAYR